MTARRCDNLASMTSGVSRRRGAMRAITIGVTLAAISITVTSLFPLNAAAANEPALVREQKTVIVDGKPETWRLQWDEKPTPACGAEDADISLTCPCSGFAYGEKAPLELVRVRADGKTERLELGSLFE